MFLFSDIVCEYPGKPRYGDIEGEFPAGYGSVVSFSCQDGFALLGESELVCHEEGTWTGDKPECKRKLLLRQILLQDQIFLCFAFGCWII